MVDLGVAIAWIVISAVSVVGLSAHVRAAAAIDVDSELACSTLHGRPGSEDLYALGARPLKPATRR